MAMPVAHALLGASVVAAMWPPDARGRSPWRPMLAGAFLAVCPDFDYALNRVPGLGGGWHHGFTHSFVFAFFAGLAAAAATGERARRRIATYGAATLSHALLDYLITTSRGVELFWPFSGEKFRLRLPNPVGYEWSDESLRRAAADVFRISLTELMLFTPLLVAVLLIRRAQKRGGKTDSLGSRLGA